jgi:hypothetical protein
MSTSRTLLLHTVGRNGLSAGRARRYPDRRCPNTHGLLDHIIEIGWKVARIFCETAALANVA